MTSLKRAVVLAIAGVISAATVAIAADIQGTPGNDTLIGTPANDNIRGHAGTDTIDGDIVRADRNDRVTSDCERVRRSS